MTCLQVFHLLRLRAAWHGDWTKETDIQKATNQDSRQQIDTNRRYISPPKNETLAAAAQLVARMGMALLQGNGTLPTGRNAGVCWGNQSQWGWAKSWKMSNNETKRKQSSIPANIHKSQDFTNSWTKQTLCHFGRFPLNHLFPWKHYIQTQEWHGSSLNYPWPVAFQYSNRDWFQTELLKNIVTSIVQSGS